MVARARVAAEAASRAELPAGMSDAVKRWVVTKAAAAKAAEADGGELGEGDLPDLLKVMLHLDSGAEEHTITGGEAVWGQADTIKGMAEFGEVLPIEHPRLTVDAFRKISEWMYTIAYYKANPDKASAEAWKTTFMKLAPDADISEWKNFFDVLLVANFLGVSDLVETFAQHIAVDIHNKRPSEILARFAPEKDLNDFKTEEEDGTFQSKSDEEIIAESYPQGQDPNQSWIDPQNHLNMPAPNTEAFPHAAPVIRPGEVAEDDASPEFQLAAPSSPTARDPVRVPNPVVRDTGGDSPTGTPRRQPHGDAGGDAVPPPNIDA